MTEPTPSRRELLGRDGVLTVVQTRPGTHIPDLHLAVTAEGPIFGFCGHVDLGTGISTALAQIVAEELDMPVETVTMVLGHTQDVPNQGPTIASETIQVTSVALRIASAQAREALVEMAAEAMQCLPEDVVVAEGAFRHREEAGRETTLAALLDGRRIELELAHQAAFKPVAQHRVVGQSVKRVDIPAKVTGAFTYVHDVRVPGMLHGRVVRPPYSGLDHGEFVGRSLIAVDEASIADIPGIRAVVIEGDFVGIVAEREEDAAAAAEALRVDWRSFTAPAGLDDLDSALRLRPATPRVLVEEGDVEAALASAETRLDRSYVWPYQMHGSIGPSCAVADVRADGITVWSGSQNPHPLQADLALLTGVPADHIAIIRHEAAGCYGRNCADDVCADAVLLSRAVGAPVRVQLTREQEHLWEPKGAAQLIDVSGGLGPGGLLAAYDFHTRYPSNAAPTLALLLTGRIPPTPATLRMGDRTALPSYNYETMRITAYDMPPIVRASWFRGVSAMPNVFAHESFIDELAHEAGEDPVAFRLRHINDERAAELSKATAERAGWEPHVGPRLTRDPETGLLRGRGFAQARYVHGNWPGVGAAWSAWVADVAVDDRTGEIAVTKVVVGQDTGMMINPAGVQHQIHGNVMQSTSRVLREQVGFSQTTAVASREWGTYPLLTFPELPAVDIVLMDKQHEPAMGAGESASVPSAAAIANAVFDATGVRFRELPLTPERVLAGLGRLPPASALPAPEGRRSRWSLAGMTAAVAGLSAFAAVSLPLRGEIAPVARPDPTTWSAATIERGRQLAALGACATCHTAEGGATNAGGRAIETPFGMIITTNITPDPETGIGNWSYAAFERAMRDGVHRDGRQLYPAFPYPSFRTASEAELQALYAYLMAQQAVSRKNEESKLAFPFNLRPLMAGWNLLFNRAEPTKTDPTRSPQWNRGRQLVEGLGHCGACHTPRNALGAERKGAAYLAGGEAEGWDAPALNQLAGGAVGWSEEELFTYLRSGTSALHGTASGPMAPVVTELRTLPDDDIKAMATYLASLGDPAPATATPEQQAANRVAASNLPGTAAASPAARLYEGACAVCHQSGRAAPLANAGPDLALSSKLSGPTPRNLMHVLLDGGAHASGSMPGFAGALDDKQLAELAGYLRSRFAPEQPAWSGVEATVARTRAARGH